MRTLWQSHLSVVGKSFKRRMFDGSNYLHIDTNVARYNFWIMMNEWNNNLLRKLSNFILQFFLKQLFVFRNDLIHQQFDIIYWTYISNISSSSTQHWWVVDDETLYLLTHVTLYISKASIQTFFKKNVTWLTIARTKFLWGKSEELCQDVLIANKVWGL